MQVSWVGLPTLGWKTWAECGGVPIGDVTYQINGMTDKNKDQVLKDFLDLAQSSKNRFLVGLFPDKIDPNSKKRPPTASDKIKVRSSSPQAHRSLLLEGECVWLID